MIYKEMQKFNQPWIWIGLTTSGLVTIAIFGIGFYMQIIRGQKFGNHPMSDQGLIIAFISVLVLFLLILLLFGIAKLTTIIDKQGISYRFFPFHLKFRRICWDEIETSEVIKYNPIGDYGGWGIKSGKAGKAYNVSGSQGLLLVLKSGKRILIGTQRAGDLIEFLEKTR